MAVNQNLIAKQSIGNKVIGGIRQGAQLAGELKTIYDVGKGIYQAGRFVAPFITPFIL